MRPTARNARLSDSDDAARILKQLQPLLRAAPIERKVRFATKRFGPIRRFFDDLTDELWGRTWGSRVGKAIILGVPLYVAVRLRPQLIDSVGEIIVAVLMGAAILLTLLYATLIRRISEVGDWADSSVSVDLLDMTRSQFNELQALVAKGELDKRQRRRRKHLVDSLERDLPKVRKLMRID
jgi:hypothetical protein